MKDAELKKYLFEIKKNLFDLNNLLITFLNGIYRFESEDECDDELAFAHNLNSKPSLHKEDFDIGRGYIG